ncbi:hypothetical protein COU53_00850 [Candidatus Pacearchaeota archaeon CG10_big_fil_rev_8_21_14_0_10_30_48]|nr:MAG: hypothetical protein COU53_00850 [Candidatus Pacearchaeota archaeon CG10_big_fil_rev_8_21_14_0_10_30_48]
MEITKLRQKLSGIKNQIGLVGGSINIQEIEGQKHNVNAHISPWTWNVEVNLRKGFNPLSTLRQRAYAKLKGINEDDGLEVLVTDVSLHEFAHWSLPHSSKKGCPYDLYNHDKILEEIKTALPEGKKNHAEYVANAFEDMIINPRVREYQGSASGQILFWDNEGHSLKQQGENSFTPFYEAFVKLNLHLFGDSLDKSLLKKHYSNDEKVDNAVRKTIEELSLPEDIQNTNQLFVKSQWPQMAQIFAKNLADLLEKTPRERLSAYSNPESGTPNQDSPQSGNGVSERMNTGKGKEEISLGRYESKEKQSSNIESFEQLNSLYRTLARSIPIEIENFSREQSLEIHPLNYRAFDSESDDARKIKPSKLVITSKGVEFAYPRDYLIIEAKSKTQRKSFPNFKMLILDNSGSMKLSPENDNNFGSTSFIPWGDNSKYHYALLGFYGIENFLQQQGIAQYINHGVSLFSSSTRQKEGNYSEIDEVRRYVLNPDWGGTTLDASQLKKSLEGRESFILSISDGEISNWNSEKSEIKSLLELETNHFAHLQIGEKTRFTKDLESWNLPVYYVSSGDDLSKLMVDITNKTYKKLSPH